jgi:hypothetical protein
MCNRVLFAKEKDNYITPLHFLYRPLAASEGVTERAQEENTTMMKMAIVSAFIEVI